MGQFGRKMGLAIGCAALCAALLAACQARLPVAAPPIEVLRLKADETPPQISGVCWARDIAPAVIETVTQQVALRPERRNAQGIITQSAQFETQTAQRIVQDRSPIWFKTPCPDTLTVAFVASLQRALKARGLFDMPVTGQWDTPTLSALRRFQRDRGLDSAQISLAAAQELGLAAR